MTDLKKLSEPELRDIMKAGANASSELNRRYMAVSLKISKRLEAGDTFKREELTFAKYAKCYCERVLAYPTNVGAGGCWDCSGILMGVANKNSYHTDKKPFVFWDIKTEAQL